MSFNNIPVMTLKFTIVLACLSCCLAQPILNTSKNNKGDAIEEKVVIAVEESRKAPAALIQLVVDNDEARKRWFQRREESLHFASNGANGHYILGKDNEEADASAIPPEESAPVATPKQLLALLKQKHESEVSDDEHIRVIRQVVHPGPPLNPALAGYPSPYVYQPQPNVYTSPPPPTTPAPAPETAAPETTTEAAEEESKVDESIQSARDEYRKSRFEGSFYALALKLSKAGNTPLSEGGSYSG